MSPKFALREDKFRGISQLYTVALVDNRRLQEPVAFDVNGQRVELFQGAESPHRPPVVLRRRPAAVLRRPAAVPRHEGVLRRPAAVRRPAGVLRR